MDYLNQKKNQPNSTKSFSTVLNCSKVYLLEQANIYDHPPTFLLLILSTTANEPMLIPNFQIDLSIYIASLLGRKL